MIQQFVRALFSVLATLCVLGLDATAAQPNCEKIQAACGEAGFTRDLPEGKDLMTKCFQPILRGEHIEGVTADPNTVKKCEDEQAQKPSKPGRKRHGMRSGTG